MKRSKKIMLVALLAIQAVAHTKDNKRTWVEFLDQNKYNIGAGLVVAGAGTAAYLYSDEFIKLFNNMSPAEQNEVRIKLEEQVVQQEITIAQKQEEIAQREAIVAQLKQDIIQAQQIHEKDQLALQMNPELIAAQAQKDLADVAQRQIETLELRNKIDQDQASQALIKNNNLLAKLNKLQEERNEIARQHYELDKKRRRDEEWDRMFSRRS